MKTLNLSQYNQMVKTVENLNPSNFKSAEISLKDVILSLPFKKVEESLNGVFDRATYVLDTGSHYFEYRYSMDHQDIEDDHSIYINKSRKFSYAAEKTIRSQSVYVLQDIQRFIAFMQPYLAIYQEEQSMLNLTKTSYSKKDIAANLEALKVWEPEASLALSKVTKTMTGKAEAMKIMLHACISYYGEETGLLYSPDQLIADLEKKLGKTYTSNALNLVLKDIWTTVAPSLSQHPKGHKLIKTIIVQLHTMFNGKDVVGIAQVRNAAYELALAGYAEL